MSIPVLCLVLAAAAALSVTIFWLVHHHVDRETFLADAPRGAAILGIVGTSFAVILAFVTLISLDSYNSAKGGAQEEALAVVETFRAAQLLPAEARVEVQGALNCYGRAVVFEEWPSMSHGSRSPVVERWVETLGTIYARIPVLTLKQQSIFNDLLTLEAKRNDARRTRLSADAPFIPAPVWFVLILAGTMTIGFATLFKDKSEAFAIQATLIAGVTVVVVAGLSVVWFLGHPYRDTTGSIRPTEMRQSLQVMNRPGAPVPCNSRGLPAKV